MKKQQITFIPVWLLMTLGTAASPFAHDTSTAAQGGNEEKHSTMLGPVRTINTIEVTDFSQYGSYASWPTLLERHAKGLKEWLVTFYSQDTNGHFRETQEILGYCRNVHSRMTPLSSLTEANPVLSAASSRDPLR